MHVIPSRTIMTSAPLTPASRELFAYGANEDRLDLTLVDSLLTSGTLVPT